MERLDHIFRVIKEPARLDDPPVSAFIDGVVTLRSNRPEAIIKGSGQEIGYKHIEVNDLVISGMNAHLGGLGISDSSGKCTPVYTILRKSIDLHERYISYYLWHAAQSGYIKSLVNAVRYNSADFGPETVKRFMVPLPPIEEQRRIADYLDEQVAQMDKLLELKTHVLGLLEEGSQAAFNTLFDDPFFVQSDVDRKSRRLALCLISNDGGVWGDEPSGENDTFVLRSTEMTKRGYWRDLENAELRSISDSDKRNSLLMLDDIIVTKASGSAEHIGKAALVSKEVAEMNACYGNFMQRLRVEKGILLPRYLHYFLKSGNGRAQLNYLGTTSTGLMNISAEVLNNLRVPIVSLLEQQQVVDLLVQIEDNFSRKMGLVDRSVSSLQELKTSLITAAVTGQFDVTTGRSVA